MREGSDKERSFWVLGSTFAKATVGRSFQLSHRVFKPSLHADAVVIRNGIGRRRVGETGCAVYSEDVGLDD